MVTGSVAGEAFALGAGGTGSSVVESRTVGSVARTAAGAADHDGTDHDHGGTHRAAAGNRLGDYVWYDANGDGLQGSGENPAPGVTASLVNAATGAVVRSTTTDGNGKYLFEGFDNGAYQVCFANPDGYRWTKQGPSTKDNVSAVDPRTGCTYPVAVEDCENLTLDAGLVPFSKPLNRLGDRVWFDGDRDGIQDPNESGVLGVKVRLIDAKTGKTVGTTYTDKNGYYLFPGLPDGKYKVCFSRPKTYLWTKQNAGGVGDDSVVSTKTGCSPVVTLGPGKRENLTIDAGIVNALRLTVVKTDKKHHKPLAGAVFQLWKDTNGKPGLQRSGAKKDTFVNDCVTSKKGRCSFGNLRAGTYYLVEKDVPEGYVLPKRPVTGPYKLTDANGCPGDGLVVKLTNKRGEPCEGKKC